MLLNMFSSMRNIIGNKSIFGLLVFDLLPQLANDLLGLLCPLLLVLCDKGGTLELLDGVFENAIMVR